jgi:hypothetical protein
LSLNSTAIAAPPPTARSRVANGSALWIDGVDGRSAEARRFRDVLATLVAEAFGNDPSEAQRAMARKAAALIVWTETLEAKLAAGADFDVGAYTTACNTLRRLLQDVGLERRAKDVTPLREQVMRGIT